MKKYLSITTAITLIFSICLMASCHTKSPEPPVVKVFDSTVVKNDISTFAGKISKDITEKGPSAWLDYFEQSPDFFMASDGRMAFKDYQTAKDFIQNVLVKSIRQIKLNWQNLRVDPLTSTFGSIGANFHEDITDVTGKVLSVDGYFTSMVILKNEGWKLRNAHWSIKKD